MGFMYFKNVAPEKSSHKCCKWVSGSRFSIRLHGALEMSLKFSDHPNGVKCALSASRQKLTANHAAMGYYLSEYLDETTIWLSFLQNDFGLDARSTPVRQWVHHVVCHRCHQWSYLNEAYLSNICNLIFRFWNSLHTLYNGRAYRWVSSRFDHRLQNLTESQRCCPSTTRLIFWTWPKDSVTVVSVFWVQEERQKKYGKQAFLSSAWMSGSYCIDSILKRY